MVLFTLLRVLQYYRSIGITYERRMIELEEKREILLLLQVMEKSNPKRPGQDHQHPEFDGKWEVLEKWLKETVIEEAWAAFEKVRMEQ